jgi:Na+/proline symporter
VFIEHFVGPNAKPDLAVEIVPHGSGKGDVVRVHVAADAKGKIVSSATEVAKVVNAHTEASKRLRVTVHGQTESAGERPVAVTPTPVRLVPGNARVYGPSITEKGEAFHPLGMALSFFVLWCFSGAGHPGFLVRLMAFKNSRDLRYSIVTVTFYFALVYVPLVFIFVASRTLIHPADLPTGSDSIMPTLAKAMVHPLLAGLLIAAPFSAVMSTVEAFLLTVSSSFVRDIYQRTFHPNASERAIKVGSYLMTVIVGVVVMFMSLDPPPFLQDIVVFSSSGIAATFLVATFLGIYWKRMTTLAAWSAMLSGFFIVIAAHIPIILRRFGLPGGGNAVVPFGIDAFVWACIVSLILGVAVSFCSARPSEQIVQAYFGRRPLSASARTESKE